MTRIPAWGLALPHHRSLPWSIAHAAPAVMSVRVEPLRALTEWHWHWKRRFSYRNIPGGPWELPREETGALGGKPILVGNCNSWAVLMRESLQAGEGGIPNGFPLGCLRLATCLTERGEPHCVLMIETEDDTLVSDVRQNSSWPWAASYFSGYQWRKRQVPGRTAWERIGERPTLKTLLRRA